MAERILGMGDVLTLIDKVQDNIDEKQARKDANKMMKGQFTLDDMLSYMKQIQKLGSLGGIMKLIPGMPKVDDSQLERAEREMKLFETIINSMTPKERAKPEILKNSRKTRIARGSGKTNADVNKVIKKYDQMKMMVKEMNSGKNKNFNPNNFKNFKF